MGVLRLIMESAADEYGFANPMTTVKRLKQVRPEIQPFSLDEVQLILNSVREDYRNYLIVRFFTGLRTGEVNGLTWKHIDFRGRRILVRETYANGRVEGLKTDGLCAM